MKKEFVPYELSVKLKELGFDEPCFGSYMELNNPQMGILIIDKCENNNDGVLAPLYQQAFRWFREKYNLICSVQYMGKNKINWWDIYVVGHYNIHYEEMWMKHQSYEEAELECLKKLIEIVKNK